MIIVLLILICVLFDFFLILFLKKQYSILKKKENIQIEATGDTTLPTLMEFGALHICSTALFLFPLAVYLAYNMDWSLIFN